MKAMIKPLLIFAVFAALCVQSGCWDQMLFDEIGFVLQMGFESDKKNELVVSMTIPVISPEAAEKVEFQYNTTKGLVRDAREKVRNVSGKLLQGGKIQHVYFSRELAEKGINEFLEIFLRNPDNPLLANVVVVDGSPKEMMELGVKYKDKPRLATYAAELLRDAHRRSCAPETRVSNFSIMNYSKTIDPITPLFRYSGENIEVAGTALFDTDKMVGLIDTQRTMLLIALTGKSKAFEYIHSGTAPAEKKETVKKGAAVMVNKVNRKIKIDVGGDAPLIDVTLELRANIDEFNDDQNLEIDRNKRKLEQEIASGIQAECLRLLKYCQEIGSDPVGFGEIVRSRHNDYWKSVEWKEVYREASFNVNVSVNIEMYGTIW